MNDSSPRKPLRRTIRGGRPFFFDDPATDKVLTMVVTLGSEVWALRERLAAVEALQVGRGQLGRGEVDAYDFTPEEEARLGADRREFIDNLFRVLQEQVDEAKARSGGTRSKVQRRAPAARQGGRKVATRSPGRGKRRSR